METETEYLDTGLGLSQSEHRSFVLSLEAELSLYFQALCTAREIQGLFKMGQFLTLLGLDGVCFSHQWEAFRSIATI